MCGLRTFQFFHEEVGGGIKVIIVFARVGMMEVGGAVVIFSISKI